MEDKGKEDVEFGSSGGGGAGASQSRANIPPPAGGDMMSEMARKLQLRKAKAEIPAVGLTIFSSYS